MNLNPDHTIEPITLKSQIHDFNFTSSPDALLQTAIFIKKPLKRRAIASPIFSTNFTPSIHINMLDNDTAFTSFTPHSRNQLLQQARNLLKLACLSLIKKSVAV